MRKKKILAVILICVSLFALTACAKEDSSAEDKTEAGASSEKAETEKVKKTETDKKSNKALVVYFSWSGNTKAVAEEIKKQTGAESFKIKPKKAYTDDYNELLDVAKEEQEQKARPEISGTIDNIKDYDVIYLGFPNWWGDMPMILYSFLDDYDLSGKTIAPFCTSGGSGFSDTISSIKAAEPKAEVLEGLSLQDSEAKNSGSAVTEWLNQ